MQKHENHRLLSMIAVGILAMSLGACGGDSSDDGGDDEGADRGGDDTSLPEQFAVGGTITGADGTIILSLNGVEESFDTGAFAFSNQLDDGDSYVVSYVSSDADETCEVSGGNGTVSGAEISNVEVVCSADPVAMSYSVGGTISGAAGTITLSLNGAEESFSAGTFTFGEQLDDGENYSVVYVASDVDENCAVSGGSGTVAGSDVTDIAVSCSDDSPPAGSSQRVSRVEQDFDNNGIPEMIATVTYSDDARKVSWVFEYIDDGTPDLFRRGSGEIILARNDVSFTESGLPLEFTIENTLEDGSTQSISWTYAYAEGKIDTITQQVINPRSVITDNTVVSSAEYSGDTLVALNSNIDYSNIGVPSVGVSYSLTYNGDGSLAALVKEIDGESSAVTDYAWRADGRLESIELERVPGGEFQDSWSAMMMPASKSVLFTQTRFTRAMLTLTSPKLMRWMRTGS